MDGCFLPGLIIKQDDNNNSSFAVRLLLLRVFTELVRENNTCPSSTSLVSVVKKVDLPYRVFITVRAR